MDHVDIGSGTLAFEVSGEGEPVLTIHGALIADAFVSLAEAEDLRDHQLIRYHRRGYGDSSRLDQPIGMTEIARDAEAILDYLAIDRAHVVGHSFGGAIAMQLAAQAPARVSTLVLEEPALMAVPAAAEFLEELGAVYEKYGAGDYDGAVRSFIELVQGPNAVEVVERSVPGGLTQAAQDAPSFFELDVAASQGWSFGPEQAAVIDAPVHFLLADETISLFRQGLDLVRSWLPHTEVTAIADTAHFLHMESPRAVGDALATALSGR